MCGTLAVVKGRPQPELEADFNCNCGAGVYGGHCEILGGGQQRHWEEQPVFGVPDSPSRSCLCTVGARVGIIGILGATIGNNETAQEFTLAKARKMTPKTRL